jgi:replication factor A1
MKAKELRSGKVDEISLKVVEIGEPREVSTRYGSSRVCDAIGEDETGQVKLALWNEEIDKVHMGDEIKITNGYVKEWRDELQLSAGRYGKLEVKPSF